MQKYNHSGLKTGLKQAIRKFFMQSAALKETFYAGHQSKTIDAKSFAYLNNNRY
jgi:hypothetical protein